MKAFKKVNSSKISQIFNIAGYEKIGEAMWLVILKKKTMLMKILTSVH